MGAPELSIVVPTLDEIDHIGGLLDSLDSQAGLSTEVIVADGGSTDGTVALCRRRGVRVVECAPGRGLQMNCGWAAARARILLFLHADSRLDHDHDHQLLRAVEAWRDVRDSRCAGHFRLRFVTRGERQRAHVWYESLSALGRPGTVNGDQGLLVSASWLDRLGGFFETLPFLEDRDFERRHLGAGGSWLLLPGMLHTSARRFEAEGMRHRSVQNALTLALFSFQHPLVMEDGARFYAPSNAQGDGLATMLDALREDLRKRSAWERLRFLNHIGRFANRNGLWRMCFAVDVRRYAEAASRTHPCLDAYDRWVAGPMDRRLMDVLIGIGLLTSGALAGIDGVAWR